MKKRNYHIVKLRNGNDFMVYTDKQLPYKMVLMKVIAMGHNAEDITSITETNLAALVIRYVRNKQFFNIDEVYDENQGECYQD